MVAQRLEFDREVCAVCGCDTGGGRSFMRAYLDEGRLEFCSPACAQVFNDEPTRFGVVPRSTGFADWKTGDWHDRFR